MPKAGLLSPQMRALLIPIVSFAILIVLIIVITRVGITKIIAQRSSLGSLQKEENSLKEKQLLLSQVDPSVLSSTNGILSALPEKNPILSVISQLKTLAGENALSLSSLKASTPSVKDGEIGKIDINFDVEGGMQSVLDFAKSITQVSPIMTIQKTTISQSAGAARASMAVRAYWASLPNTLPALTEPVSLIQTEERSLFAQVLELRSPTLLEVAPESEQKRDDPFN